MIYVPDSNPSLFERYNFRFFVDKMAFAFYSNKIVNIKFLHVLYNDDAIRGHSITKYLLGQKEIYRKFMLGHVDKR